MIRKRPKEKVQEESGESVYEIPCHFTEFYKGKEKKPNVTSSKRTWYIY